jgi:hypothetical protein
VKTRSGAKLNEITMRFILMMNMKTDKASQSQGIMSWPGDLPAVLVSYQTAAAQTASQPERVYLVTQAACLRER